MAERDRPTGEQVLATLHTRQHTRLRIYIGAAPGVGKTYSMIDDAHALRRSGVDVVGASWRRTDARTPKRASRISS